AMRASDEQRELIQARRDVEPRSMAAGHAPASGEPQWSAQLGTGVSATGENRLPPGFAGTTFYDFHGPGSLTRGMVDSFGDTKFYDFRGPAGRITGTSDRLAGTTIYSFQGPGGRVTGTSDSFGPFRFYNLSGPDGPTSGMSYNLGGFTFH